MIFGLGWHQTKAAEELLNIHGVVICKPHTEAQVSTVCRVLLFYVHL